jgi:CheY-like chemotaxis protein
MILSPVTVLVVEDEPLLCELMADELKTLGFTVLRAATGEEAVKVIEGEEPVDVLFTDIRLPGALDGWDVAEKFRRGTRRGRSSTRRATPARRPGRSRKAPSCRSPVARPRS